MKETQYQVIVIPEPIVMAAPIIETISIISS
jgi:hypothetical protein